MSLDWWREAAREWLPDGSAPTNQELGVRMPWRELAAYALSSQHRRRVDDARRILDRALGLGIEWRMAVSCGKDSTALAVLCADDGWSPRAMSVKDDLDYPGERQYAERLAARCEMEIDVISPTVSLLEYLRTERISLVDDVHSRAADLSRDHFYRLLDDYREQAGHDGVILGLRGEESRGRRMNVATHGDIYTRAYDGFTVAQPLARWSAHDVHAYLLAHGIPCLPVYLCIDIGMEPLSLRKSWWIAGGGPARHGHYVWLRRWWPELWDVAVSIDEQVAVLG